MAQEWNQPIGSWRHAEVRFDGGRRLFLKTAAAAGGGLLLSFQWTATASDRPVGAETAKAFAPNAWIHIGTDHRITLYVDRTEMGQGVATALPMLVAEELEIGLDAVHIEFAPAAPEFANPMFRVQATGGSTSVRAAWRPLREAGAVARTLLIQAAAELWSVTPDVLRADQGRIVHRGDGRAVRYGELAERAARLPVPRRVRLKPAPEFTLIGRSQARLDTPIKVNGRAVYGMDVRLPGMLYAAIIHAPTVQGTLAGVDASVANTLPGVRRVVRLPNAVAVVADSYWQAQQALGAVKIRWNPGPHAELDSAAIAARFRRRAQERGRKLDEHGDVERALAKATRRVRAEYELPYLAHACMEPMNCTAHVHDQRCEVWAPTQAQSAAQETAARVAGIGRHAVTVHTTYVGGGFGRRAESDFVAEAVHLSKAVGAPVKLIWSREQDIRHDFFRPASLSLLEGAIDASGRPIAWRHRVVAPSIMRRFLPDAAPAVMPAWMPSALRRGLGRVAGALAGLRTDSSSVEGATDLLYDIPHRAVEYVEEDPGVPVGFWRSVGHSHTVFAVESFIDELAEVAGSDGYQFRRGLLQGAPRDLAVLERAAQRAGWGRAVAPNRFQGIARHASYGSHVAQVVEISLDAQGAVRVERVVCAIDCGTVVNPDTVVAQMESAVAFALSAALYGEISLAAGAVQQSNFHDYPIIRLRDMPEVVVEILPSTASPGGVGEPGVPPLAPALANAWYAATGERHRRLPLLARAAQTP